MSHGNLSQQQLQQEPSQTDTRAEVQDSRNSGPTLRARRHTTGVMFRRCARRGGFSLRGPPGAAADRVEIPVRSPPHYTSFTQSVEPTTQGLMASDHAQRCMTAKTAFTRAVKAKFNRGPNASAERSNVSLQSGAVREGGCGRDHLTCESE
ncbi:unnamed protein product [Pleuronectes platessa]|uniref:Uncharacterized protein n=1 Tax=Pleuronectes platessa TaxID=8262 RepID=A0A9N7VVE4_PLEPL|nr:unnamed protein product [Pleuronectes platessa]